MSAIYYAIPTNKGQARIANAIALGIPLKITHMAVGDGNGKMVTPNPAMIALVREKRRAPLNTLFQDPLNQSQLVAEQIIPEDVGDWWVREVGLYDDSGTMIAIANCPDTYKPLLSSGSGRTQVIRMVLIVSDTSAVELKIDSSVVLATRKYVDDLMKAHREGRSHPDASETEKGFSRHATKEDVTSDKTSSAVVTVEKLWQWSEEGCGSDPDRQASVMQAMVDGLPVKICVIGDSITNGMGVPTPYPLRLQEILREWYNNPNITVINRGHSGADTRSYLTRYLAEAIEDNADLYLIALGVNDANRVHNINVDQYEDGLRDLYHRLSFAAVSFCSLTDVTGLQASIPTNPYGIDVYRSKMKHIAKICGARYIDSYSVMQRFLFNRGDARSRLSRDETHWSQAGYDLIAEAVFLNGFAGINLEIAPNQFIDGITTAYRGIGNQQRTLNTPYGTYTETIAESESKLYIFNTSLKPAYLLAHFTSFLSQDGVVTGQVTVKNSAEPTPRTYTLDVANATGFTNNYLSDVPTSVCDLAPGLNIITFTTPAEKTFRVMGFTVKEYADPYNVMMREKGKVGSKISSGIVTQEGVVENTKYYLDIPFKRFGSNHSNGVDGSTDYRLPRSLCTLIPKTYGETRFRIRGFFGGNCTLNLGYQIKYSPSEQEYRADCTQLFAIDFQGGATHMRMTSYTGTAIFPANIVNSPKDQCIDIITSEAGTQFFVNGALLWRMAIKLPEVDMFVSSSYNLSVEGVVIESVGEVGVDVAPNAFVPGEKWFSHADSKMHMIDKTGAHKTVQFV